MTDTYPAPTTSEASETSHPQQEVPELIVTRPNSLLRILLTWVPAANLSSSLGILIITGYLLIGILGPAITPYSATQMQVDEILRPPTLRHPFGTDQYGRDILSRVLIGTRSILVLAVSSTIMGVFAGTFLGLVAAYLGGRPDEVLMRAMDILMALPMMLLAILILTTLGSSSGNLIVGIGVVFMPRVARVVRSAVLTVRDSGFVEAARLRGDSAAYIMLAEILPVIWEIVSVEAGLRFSYAILLSASLGFLGLGVQPPTPNWGLMVAEGRNFIAYAPWSVIFPALAIASLVVAVNLVNDVLWERRRRPPIRGFEA